MDIELRQILFEILERLDRIEDNLQGTQPDLPPVPEVLGESYDFSADIEGYFGGRAMRENMEALYNAAPVRVLFPHADNTDRELEVLAHMEAKVLENESNPNWFTVRLGTGGAMAYYGEDIDGTTIHGLIVVPAVNFRRELTFEEAVREAQKRLKLDARTAVAKDYNPLLEHRF